MSQPSESSDSKSAQMDSSNEFTLFRKSPENARKVLFNRNRRNAYCPDHRRSISEAQPCVVSQNIAEKTRTQRRSLTSFSHPDLNYVFTSSDINLWSSKSRQRVSVRPTKSAQTPSTQNINESPTSEVSESPNTGDDSEIFDKACCDFLNKFQLFEDSNPISEAPVLDWCNNFDRAQQFFEESGILGPTMSSNSLDLIRRTSKIRQDPNVKSQIRKTSLTMRSRMPSEKSPLTISMSENPEIKRLEEENAYLRQILSNTVLKFRVKHQELLRCKRALKEAYENMKIETDDIKSKYQKDELREYSPRYYELDMILAPFMKRQGVSGESCEVRMQKSTKVSIPKYNKDFRSKQLIKDAITENDFLKHIDGPLIRELADSMYSVNVVKDEFVIQEGEHGAHLYVSAAGYFDVIKNGKVLNRIKPGEAFGELAILYNCTRTASVRAISNATVWVLDRRIYQQIMMRTGLERIENSVNFLKSVPLLSNLTEDILVKIADALEVEFFAAGTYIIRQGANGDTFFLISQGSVKVTQKSLPAAGEVELRTLCRGDYFGEQALINDDKRTANIIALEPGVECLTLDRESFMQLIGDLCELKEKTYNTDVQMANAQNPLNIFGENICPAFPDMQLKDLEFITTLGMGGFGRVELVKHNDDVYALKCLKKKHIIDSNQQDHVMNERNILLYSDCPFICRLYRTFRDSKYVYLLLEACMGGEIWTLMRRAGAFPEGAAQFIVACALQAFGYLHARGIVYRDLKPENLMIDHKGYVKLVDFGFAKYIGSGSKTWTFCGTPEYVSPEVILNKGHDHAVDYWALGILIYETLEARPPFSANDPLKTYKLILKGIDMVSFPIHMSRSAVQLVKKLCRRNPVERIGYQKGGLQDVKKHKWFLGFDWDGLENQTLKSPFVPKISSPTDTKYFDEFPKETNEAPEESSGWDADF